MAEAFGPFVLDRLLGRGGMAEVLVAHRRDDRARRPLVIKRIRADLAHDDEYLKRFVLEAQVASRLSHPNLVRFYEFGKVGACHYIALELVSGYSLGRLIEQVIAKRAPPPLEVALYIAAGVLDGLSAMHGVTDEEGRSRPMLHRDVTPSNVIITREGRPVLIDFGIAKDILGPAITMPGKVIGTARYMAPEHRKAEYIDPRADVFSVSVIFYELLIGRHPWKPLEMLKELLRVTFDPPEIPDEARARIPDDVLQIALKGLACEPADRYAAARDMWLALTGCETYARVRDSGETSARTWAGSLGIRPDDDLDRPVVDHGPQEAELVWGARGQLRAPEAPSMASLPAVASAQVLSVPPLPPPREAALEREDVALEDGIVRGKNVWVAVALALVAVLGAIAGFFWLRSLL